MRPLLDEAGRATDKFDISTLKPFGIDEARGDQAGTAHDSRFAGFFYSPSGDTKMLHETAIVETPRREITTVEVPQPFAGRRAQRPQILIPTQLTPADRTALTLGLEMAAARRADVILLHVIPQAEVAAAEDVAMSFHWLDAIHNLHRALDVSPAARTRDRILAEAREKMAAWLSEGAAGPLRSQVHVQLECSLGDAAEEIERYAAFAGVELVVLSSGLSRWGLPVLPGLTHDLLQRIRKPVVVIRPELAQRAATGIRAAL